MSPHPIVQRLTARRHELGLSQLEVASRAGIAQATLSYIESGGRQPSLATLTAIAATLDRRLGLEGNDA